MSINQAMKQKYQSKSITPIDDYKCNLSPELLEVLEKHLRETEESRKHGIEALREWTMQNPRIVLTRLDTNWLLKHLRFKKYSIPAAQEAIERHLVLTQGVYGHTYFHVALDILQPCVKNIFDVVPVCLLADRDKEGRPILFYRFANIKPDSSLCLLQDGFTALKCLFESLGEREDFLIRGIVHVMDISGMTPDYVKVIPMDDGIKILKNGEKCVATRFKGIHIVNVPFGLSYIANFLLKHCPQKIRERVKLYKNFDELDIVEKKSLPKEYGGTTPMRELMQPLWDMMMEDRDIHMKYDDMHVDEKLYPKACFEGSTEMLKIPLNSEDLFEEAKRCNSDALFGVQGSFRKLEID